MLKLPSKVERSISDSKVEEQEMLEDSDKPTILPILRVTGHTGTKEQRKEKENNERSNGTAISSTGLLQYEDLLHHLTCPSCSQVVSPPVSQCRKGHLYCRDCRTNNKIVSCRICKQTFLDAPNLALEKIITFIALPCKYGPHGCPSSVFLPTRLQHETVCQFRPVNCQFQPHGCEQVFSVKDMCWHHKMCPYAHHPHKHVLPNMPARKKSSSKSAKNSSDTKQDVISAGDDETDTDSDKNNKCKGETTADSDMSHHF